MLIIPKTDDPVLVLLYLARKLAVGFDVPLLDRVIEKIEKGYPETTKR